MGDPAVAVLLAYGGVLLWLGWRFGRSPAARSYLLAGRSRRYWAMCAGLGATVIGGSATVGLFGLAARDGLAAAAWFWGGAAGLGLAGWLVARPAVRSGVYTVPQYLERVYGRGVGRLAAAVIVLAWLGVIAAQLLAAGRLLRSLWAVPLEWVVPGVALGIGWYVRRGGQAAVFRADGLNLGLILAGLGVLAVEVAAEADPVGGWVRLGGAWRELWAAPVSGWELAALGLVVAVVFATGPDIFTRFLCAAGERPARAAAWTVGAALIPLSVGVAGLGVVGGGLLPEAAGDDLLPALAAAFAPAWARGLILAGMLAAVVSSADTCLMTTSTILATAFRPAPPAGPAAEERVAREVRRWVPGVLAGALAVALGWPSILGVLLAGYLVYVAAVSPLLLTAVLTGGRAVVGRWMARGTVAVGFLAAAAALTTGQRGWVGAWLAAWLAVAAGRALVGARRGRGDAT